MIKTKSGNNPKISQGDIYRNIDYIENVCENNGIIEVSKIEFPLIVILSQDCDLTWDYKNRYGRPKKNNQDKFMFSILCAPLYNVEHLIEGNHLELLNQKMQIIPKYSKRDLSTQYKALINNEIPRYHYLEFPKRIPIVPSVIDFKHYFTVSTKALKEKKDTSFVCKVAELFREDITLRFSNYLSRIGLPS